MVVQTVLIIIIIHQIFRVKYKKINKNKRSDYFKNLDINNDEILNSSRFRKVSDHLLSKVNRKPIQIIVLIFSHFLPICYVITVQKTSGLKL